jgi:hypothetical protein
MSPDSSSFAAGTRRLMLGGAICAAILFIGFIAWPLMTENQVGTPQGGANPAKTTETTVGRTAPAQQAAESTVGKNDPAGQEDSSGRRARALKQSSRALQLDEGQRRQIKEILGRQASPPMTQPGFELMIGTAVPGQVQLQDIPPEITQMMNGYWGDQYVLTNDKLIIVDQHTRRIVAIVPTA